MRKFLFSLGIIIASSTTLHAQQIIKCFTDEIRAEILKTNPEYLQEEELANQTARLMQSLQKNTQVRYIPVVFHVIHKYGFENISQTQINDAIRVLNEDFRKKTGTNGGSSTDPLAVDMLYEFRLAQLDPNGNPTNGVNRIYSLQTDNASDAMKSLSNWDKNRYFNIWVVNTINSSGQQGIVLGYAQFPFFGAASTDGVVIRADQMGAIELGQLSQVGRTLTHEAGHWLGLYHPFQGGCPNSNCSSQGDQVCDTPPVASATNGCPSNRNSCSTDSPDLPDMVRNYMDYADGTCMNLFTVGQKNRVDPIMAQYRSYVYSTANINGAGINTDGTYRPLQPSPRKAPYSYSFENTNPTADGWKFENYMCPGDTGWHINNAARFNGERCMAANNNRVTRLNVRNAFVSPTIDVTTLNNPSLSFNVAYAKRVSVSNDRLRIFVSNSHGREEILAANFSANDIETGPMSTEAFIPNSTQWKRISVDLSAYKSYTNLSVRFELQNLRGNNIYIDDFSIGEFTGLNNELKNTLQFNAYPNPASTTTNLEFVLNQKQHIHAEIFDMSGKLINTIINDELESGYNSINFNTEELTNGIYLLKFKTNAGFFTHKLMIAQ
ncbi:MAG: M43 family zinc metalloprotease [Bacteroidia bacterium]